MSWLSNLFGGGSGGGQGGANVNPANAAMPYLNQIEGVYTNPNTYNTVASQYHESPGFKYKLQHALEAQKNMAAAGGMSGSMQSQLLGEQTAEDLTNQDFNQYLAQRLGISQDLANVLGLKAQYGYGGQAGMNQLNAAKQNQQYGLLGAGIGGALGLLGGPVGSSIGSFLFGSGKSSS